MLRLLRESEWMMKCGVVWKGKLNLIESVKRRAQVSASASEECE